MQRINGNINLKTSKVRPLKEDHYLPISVSKYYTDVDGTVIDKATLPTNLKTRLPFYLFNYYDYIGGYKIGYTEVPLDVNWKLYQYSVFGNNNFLFFTGLNNIKDRMNIGDLVFTYTDDLNNPNYYAFIIISAGNASIASINESMNNDANMLWFNYNVQDASQYREMLYYVRQDFLMQPTLDKINPQMFKNPFNEQSALIKTDISFKFSKTFGLYSYINFTNDLISFEFKINYNYAV